MAATEIEIWECPPLKAKLTRRHCALNRTRAASGRLDPSLAAWERELAATALALLKPCKSCPGVEWWAERLARGPTRVSLDDGKQRSPSSHPL